MNFLMVGLTFLTIALVFLGVAALGSDRLFPARKTALFIAQDGINISADKDAPLIVPADANIKDYKELKLGLSPMGYDKDEVDALLKHLVSENQRLRSVDDRQVPPSDEL